MRADTRILLPDSLSRAMADTEGLDAWRVTPDGRRLERTIECGSFLEAIALVGRVALLAEAADHHPDIDVRWKTVRLALSTHSAGGVTAKDLELAEWIERVVP